MNSECPLCDLIQGDARTYWNKPEDGLICVDYSGHPMVMSYEHKPEFSPRQKELINRKFPDEHYTKTWKMRQKDHAQIHIKRKREVKNND